MISRSSGYGRSKARTGEAATALRRRHRVTWAGIFAALLMLGGGAVLVFLTGQGSGGTLFQGIPNDRIHVPLSLASSDSAPAISSGQAIATAIREGASFQPGTSQAVQETVLLTMKETRPGLPQNRLIWGVRFQDPSAALGSRYRFMGPDGNVPNEAEFAIALVDATNGEYILTMEGWNQLQTLPPGLTPPPPLPASQ